MPLRSLNCIVGLCGSDLHTYRGHDMPPGPFVMGHEFVGEVVALGSSYGLKETGNRRSELYSTLKVGDKVVSPFTTSCGECQCVVSRTLFHRPRSHGNDASYFPLASVVLVSRHAVYTLFYSVTLVSLEDKHNTFACLMAAELYSKFLQIIPQKKSMQTDGCGSLTNL